MALTQEDLDILLITAIKRNDAEEVVCALQAGADPNAVDDFARTEPPGLLRAYRKLDSECQFLTVPAIHVLFAWRPAVGRGSVFPPENLPILNALLDAGADIDAQNTYGESPLYLAVAQYKTATMQILLARGADPNLSINGGNTPIMAASSKRHIGYRAIIRKLLRSNADINRQNVHGVTALMIATMHGNADTVRLLLQRGAEPDLQASNGDTALRIAQEFKPEIVPLLEKAQDAFSAPRKRPTQPKRKRRT